MKTYFLEIQKVVYETNQAVTIYFWHPISEQIKYLPGQFLTLFMPGSKDRKLRRSYSICTSPLVDSSIGITIKRVKGGIMSNYFNDFAKVGDFVEVLEPMGNFTFSEAESAAGNLVLVGAGSGITPLISILKSALKSGSRKIKLIYGNKSVEDAIFKKTLDELVEKNAGRLDVIYFYSQSLAQDLCFQGRINSNALSRIFIDKFVNFNTDLFYSCGPEGLFEELRLVLDVHGVRESQIFHERFNAPVAINDHDIAESTVYTVKIIFEGEEYSYDVLPHQTILDVGLDLEIDLPYSCQAGMCSSCMAKCLSGTVRMDEDEGLTDKEKKEGYILTCVGHPTSDGVVLEFE